MNDHYYGIDEKQEDKKGFIGKIIEVIINFIFKLKK
jgi:hypothetical protein